MGLLGFLLGKSKIEKELKQQEGQIKKSFKKVKKDIGKIEGRVEELEKVVTKSELEKIVEEIVSKVIAPKEEMSRKVESIVPKRKVISKPAYSELSLSPAQKRIISILAQHNDMAMSYKDISAVLNLSPTTVKNTINQIKKNTPNMLKEKSDGGAKRYRLNNSLKLKTMIQTKSDSDESEI